MASQPADPPARPTLAQTAGLMVLITLGVFGYATLCSLAGVTLIHGGFLFLFYWAGVRGANADELIPSFVGALGGTGLAWVVITLPLQMGTAGYAIIALAVVAAIFMMIRGHFPLLINNAFMLYLTVFTMPGAVAPNDYAQVAGSVLIAGGLAILAMTIAKRVAARKQRAATTA